MCVMIFGRLGGNYLIYTVLIKGNVVVDKACYQLYVGISAVLKELLITRILVVHPIMLSQPGCRACPNAPFSGVGTCTAPSIGTEGHPKASAGIDILGGKLTRLDKSLAPVKEGIGIVTQARRLCGPVVHLNVDIMPISAARATYYLSDLKLAEADTAEEAKKLEREIILSKPLETFENREMEDLKNKYDKM